MKKMYPAKLVFSTLVMFFIVSGLIAQTKTWYVINNVTSGELVGWQNPDNWTEDPSGVVYSNPGSDIPVAEDNVVVKSGKAITIPAGTTISAATVTVDGIIYIEGPELHSFATLRGSGSLYLKSGHFPSASATHFITESEGAGTVVYYGDGPIAISTAQTFCNLEIDMSGNNASVTYTNNLTLNGSLNIKKGKLLMSGTTALTMEVKKDISVQTNGFIGVTTDAAYHNMIAWGNFYNYGTLLFSNAAQYAAATNGAIRLKFKGAANNTFAANGQTFLYRLFVDKGDNDFYTLSVTSNNTSNFKLLGPVSTNVGIETSESGLAGWEKLPLVIRKGTLKLGANIIIDKLGYNRDGNEPNEFHIPAGAALWINGASLTTLADADFDSNIFQNTGITIGGELRITAGLLKTPQYSRGIRYNGTTLNPAILKIEGGSVSTSQIRPYSDGDLLNYSQSDGVIDFKNQVGGNEYGYAIFDMVNSNQIFETTGGTMIFRVANNNNVTGIEINVADGNYNVTGGSVEVYVPSDKDFKICSTVPFYNLTTFGTGSTKQVQMTNLNGNTTDTYFNGNCSIYGNLTIGSGSVFNIGAYELLLGGDLVINGSFINSSGGLTLNRSANATLYNNTASVFALNSIEVTKDAANDTVYVGGSGGFSIGDLTLTRGNLDLVNKTIPVSSNISLYDGNILASSSGAINLIGGSASSELYSAKGKTLSFGVLNVNKAVTLKSHANARQVNFGGNHIFDLGVFNLEINQADYSSITGWGTTRMFRTTGKASDGGLTLNFDIPASQITTVALFPVGTTVYSPSVIKTANGNSVTTKGALTVIPVNSAHPSTEPGKNSEVLNYYWRTRVEGFSDLDENVIRLEFTSPSDLKGMKSAFLNDLEWVVGSYGYKQTDPDLLIFNSTANYGPYSNLINADYTAGISNGNGQIPIAGVNIFTSTGNHYWHSSSWIDQDGNTNVGPPGASDIAIIKEGHTVTINANGALASQVHINGMLEVAHNKTGHIFDILKGYGHLRYINDFDWGPNNLITADYTEFCDNSIAVVEFAGSGSYWLPALSVIPYYPNLHISGGGTKNTPYEGNVTINENLYVDNSVFSITNISSGVLSIGKDLMINTGSMILPSGSTHNTYIEGDIIFTGTGSLKSADNGGENSLYLKGDIELANGTIDFASNNRKNNLCFTGDSSSLFSGNNADASKAKLYRVTVSKEVVDSVLFSAPFSLAAVANQTLKPLVLESGIALLNNPGIDLTLNSGGADFQIPSTSVLIVDNGSTVRASGSNSSLYLDGALEVNNSGKFLWEGTGGNHLKYSASGNASIWLGANTQFHVGSQLYRNADGGVLKFTQASNSSNVKIATIDAPRGQNGVFEMLNEGSEFTQTEENSIINILRGQTAATEASLLFDPATVTISTGSKFIMGAAGSQNMTLYANKPLGGLQVTASSTVKLVTSPVTLSGNLTIDTGSTLNANNLDITLLKDLIANGTYTPGTNTTFFESNSEQTITGTVGFNNLDKITGTGKLSIGGLASVMVNNDLQLLNGSIDTYGDDLEVKGDATISFGTTIGGLDLNGTEQQLLSGGGQIGRLTIDNAAGVMVPSQPDAVIVSEKLVMANGILDIGRNLLELTKEAAIVDGSGGLNFSESNMIQTFLSFTDAGIRKYFPSISKADGQYDKFVFPIGSQDKYTPIIFDINTISSLNGSIRVKAANERHISILDLSSTPALNEQQNVLQYYWTLDASNISGFKAKVNMQAYAEDVVRESGITDDYIVARILAGGDLWNRLNINNGSTAEEEKIYFKTIDNTLIFNGYFATGTDDKGISGDYTAGIAAAIPERVPTYISVLSNGNWNNEDSWAVYNPDNGTIGTAGEDVQEGGPFGAIVYIRESINTAVNGRVAYRTYIEPTANLNVGTTINNRLGNVFGSGRLRVESGSLPAGFYEDFFLPTGGTIEYAGNTTYSVLAESSILNNVEFTGSGERILPNGDVRFYGNMLINGPIVNFAGTTTVQIGKDLTYNLGELYTSSSSHFTFNGSVNQTIGGLKPFTGTNGLHQITINNNQGVNIATDVDVLTDLTLNNGIINTLSGGKLSLIYGTTTLTVANNSNYINGPLYKFINGSESFIFPLGKNGRYGEIMVADASSGGLWEAEYYNNGPADRTTVTDPLKYVSSNEYWRIVAPTAGTQSSVTIRWDENSGVNPDDLAFRVVSSDNGSAWEQVGYTNKTGDMSGGTVKTNVLAYNTSRRFTFGSISIDSYTWIGSTSADWFTGSNWYGGAVPSASNNVTINTETGKNNPNITLGSIAVTSDLSIMTGSILTVKPGGKLTINGDLTITDAGSLILESQTGVNGLASLINKGNITGSANIRLNNLAQLQWYYLSSSINSATFGNFDTGTAGASVYAYRNNKWLSTNSTYTNTPLLPMEGVLVKYDPQKNINYTGTLNSGSDSFSRTYNTYGWYLFGNPYPCFIDWQDDAGTGWSRPNIVQTMWYRTNIGSVMAFVTYNRTAPKGARAAFFPTGALYSIEEETELSLIPPMQAVWVRASSATTISVNESARSHGNSASYLKSGSTGSSADIIRVVSSNKLARDGAVIYFWSNSTEEMDQSDSEKRLNDSEVVPEVYTRINTTPAAINGLSQLDDNGRIIPLSVRNRVSDEVTMTFNLELFNSGHSVELEDKETGELVNLRATPNYTYTPSVLGEVNDRFVIHISYSATPVVNPEEEEVSSESDDITITGMKGRAIVKIDYNLLESADALIEIFTLNGQKISKSTSGTNMTLVNLPQENSLFVIKVTAGGVMKTEKVFGKL